MTTQVSDSVDIRDASQGTLSISTSAAQSAAIADTGTYDLSSTVDCFIKIHAVADDVTAASGYPLYLGNVVAFQVAKGQKIGAITATGTGTLRWHRVAV
jgi:hypothetical protein